MLATKMIYHSHIVDVLASVLKTCAGTNNYDCDTCGASLNYQATLAARMKGKSTMRLSWQASICRHMKTSEEIYGRTLFHVYDLRCSDVLTHWVTKTTCRSSCTFNFIPENESSVDENLIHVICCRQQCYGDTQSGSNLVGRDLTRRDVISNITACNQCCSMEYCNRGLCSHSAEIVSNPGQCADSPEYNCQLISSTFNICNDVHHAKTVCRKFCGLCDLVDGGWSAWSEWSLCEQTCGESQKVRVRACNDPAPAHGGLDCIGDRIDYQNCSLSPCPVAGGWSDWSGWTACSQTCGVGLQRRGRTCSNPYPDNGGDHCFGDALDDRVCYSKPCADGGWSLWSTWSTCTVTCNGGLASRKRTCSNPAPTLLGRQCEGNSVEYTSCNSAVCPVTSSMKKVYFAVNTPTGHLYSDHAPVFSKIVLNEGNAYDMSTGTVRIPVPGVYQFFVTFVTTTSRTQCFIRKNRNVLVYALTTASTDWKSASASTYVHCVIGDVIDLSCGGWQYVDHNASSMFSGALVSAD